MRRALAFCLMLLAAAACVPAPPTTPSQTAIKSDQMGLGPSPAPTVAADWWAGFNDPKLDTIVGEALGNSPTLAASLARMRQAEAGFSATAAATYPQVTFDINETRERFSKDYIIPPPFGGTWQWFGTIQSNLSWEIDIWGHEAAMVAQARASANASALDAASARLALSSAVVDAYIGLARADALVAIAGKTLEDRNRVYALTSERYKDGLENNAAVKQAEALAAQASQDLTRTKAARDILVHELAALIGRGADAYAAIEATPLTQENVLPLPDALPLDLLGRRPDILAAEARIDAAVSGRKVARTAFYPNVNLIAFAGWQAIGLNTLFSASSLAYGAGPAISMPIFDAGKLRAEYAGATAELDEAVADYNQNVVTAVQQTADALTQVRALESERADEKRALAAAETSFRLAVTRYRTGLSDQLILLQSEDTLLRARQDEANLDADTLAARVTLLIAVGGGFEPDRTIAANGAAGDHQEKTP